MRKPDQSRHALLLRLLYICAVLLVGACDSDPYSEPAPELLTIENLADSHSGRVGEAIFVSGTLINDSMDGYLISSYSPVVKTVQLEFSRPIDIDRIEKCLSEEVTVTGSVIASDTPTLNVQYIELTAEIEVWQPGRCY